MYQRYLCTFLKRLQMEGCGIRVQVPFRGVDIRNGRAHESLRLSDRVVALSLPHPGVPVIGPKGDMGL